MPIAALFIVANLWIQLRCPTTDGWIKKMLYIIYIYVNIYISMYVYREKFYSAIKKNEILSFTGKWMELENITLSEVSQVQKSKTHVFSLICGR
jgi:hypothetical protein